MEIGFGFMGNVLDMLVSSNGEFGSEALVRVERIGDHDMKDLDSEEDEDRRLGGREDEGVESSSVRVSLSSSSTSSTRHRVGFSESVVVFVVDRFEDSMEEERNRKEEKRGGRKKMSGTKGGKERQTQLFLCSRGVSYRTR